MAEAKVSSRRKLNNLNNGKQGKVPVILNFGGQKAELWCPGGEIVFLKHMAKESAAFASQVCWFTSLVSKKDNIPPLKKLLTQLGASQIVVVIMRQGQKISRFIAWSFLSTKQQEAWAEADYASIEDFERYLSSSVLCFIKSSDLESLKAYVLSALPTIYADMNVYRYIAYSDISIEKPKRFRWIYSYVHLNEMIRNGNTDALEGIRVLGAVEIADVLNEQFESVGNIVLKSYIDPNERYKQHLDTIAGFEDKSNFMVEHLLRSFGADNFNELLLTPEKLCEEIDRLTSGAGDEIRGELLKRAEEASTEMRESINKYFKDRRPIDDTRLEMGLTSDARKKAENSDSPIDELWEIIGPSIGVGITKNQFFGFEQLPGIQGVQHTQHGAFAGAHIVVNMLGLSPDKGLAKRDKIKSIMSDGQHVGMASYCSALLSADKRYEALTKGKVKTFLLSEVKMKLKK